MGLKSQHFLGVTTAQYWSLGSLGASPSHKGQQRLRMFQGLTHGVGGMSTASSKVWLQRYLTPFSQWFDTTTSTESMLLQCNSPPFTFPTNQEQALKSSRSSEFRSALSKSEALRSVLSNIKTMLLNYYIFIIHKVIYDMKTVRCLCTWKNN